MLPSLKQTLLSALCFSIMHSITHETLHALPFGLLKLSSHLLPCPTEIEIDQKDNQNNSNYNTYHRNTALLPSNQSVLINKTYSVAKEQNLSNSKLLEQVQQMIVANMEDPQPISTLFTDWDEMAYREYQQIEELTKSEETDTQVPETNIIGASFVKTPFLEVLPSSDYLDNSSI